MHSKYIKKTYIILILVMIFTSCIKDNKSSSKITSNVQSIDIDIDINKVMDKVTDSFEKIELIQLETNDSTLIGKIKFVKYIEGKYFIFMNNNLIVQVFDTKGNFVSNSKKCYGNGPNEYYTITDATYNKFTDRFELLDFDNKIFCYDKSFKFVEKYDIKENEVQKYYRFIPIGNSAYVLTPSFTEPMNKICLFDSKTKKVEVLKFDGNLSNLSMQECPFTYFNEDIVFSPTATNYSIFKLNNSGKSLDILFKLNLLRAKIDEKVLLSYQDDIEKRNYLMNNSNSVLPVRNLVSSDYVVSLLIRNNVLFSNIFNVSIGKSVIVKHKNDELNLPIFFGIDKNILYACIYPFEIDKYIDKNLLDSKSHSILSKKEDESNPIIVKYYLK